MDLFFVISAGFGVEADSVKLISRSAAWWTGGRAARLGSYDRGEASAKTKNPPFFRRGGFFGRRRIRMIAHAATGIWWDRFTLIIHLVN